MRPEPRMMATATGALPLGIQPPVLRMLGWCLALVLIAAALAPAVPKLASPPMAMTLAVSGDLRHVEADEVKRAVASHLNRDFYELDLIAVKAAVEALPWVARARVERHWPATVAVQVREHRAVARWGDASLVSDEDIVFTPSVLDGDVLLLPRLAGPHGRQAEVRSAFETLRDQLRDTGFAPVQLDLNPRGEWTARTTHGIELRLGRGAPLDAVPLLAGPVRTALEGRLQEVTYVDLHYINGFAVGWREQRAADARSPADAERRDG